jgi:hypothetical protein
LRPTQLVMGQPGQLARERSGSGLIFAIRWHDYRKASRLPKLGPHPTRTACPIPRHVGECRAAVLSI